VKLLSFGGLHMNTLLTFLDYLVSELEFYLEVKRAERLTEELDYLNAIAFLDEYVLVKNIASCANNLLQ
jgi:hypothetical protein